MSNKLSEKTAAEMGKTFVSHANYILGFGLTWYIVAMIAVFFGGINAGAAIAPYAIGMAFIMLLCLPLVTALLCYIKSFAECFAKHMANVEELKLRTNAESQTSPEEKTNE